MPGVVVAPNLYFPEIEDHNRLLKLTQVFVEFVKKSLEWRESHPDWQPSDEKK